MKPCIVNVAIGSWYPTGQRRLQESVAKVMGDRVDFLGFSGLPAGCPPHSSVPYAFKTHALIHAYRKGYTQILWLDASMWVVGDLTPIFEHARVHGAAVWKAGWTVGEWCSDAALPLLGVIREGARTIPLCCGGIVAIDTGHPMGIQLLTKWHSYAVDGRSFRGPWDNKAQGASKDPTVLGHRHDMPALSVLTQKLGIPSIDPPKWFAYSTDECPVHPEALVLARGM